MFSLEIRKTIFELSSIFPLIWTSVIRGSRFDIIIASWTQFLLGANSFLNPIALRKTKIVYNFGLSRCSRVKSRALTWEGFIAKQWDGNRKSQKSCSPLKTKWRHWGILLHKNFEKTNTWLFIFCLELLFFFLGIFGAPHFTKIWLWNSVF